MSSARKYFIRSLKNNWINKISNPGASLPHILATNPAGITIEWFWLRPFRLICYDFWG